MVNTIRCLLEYLIKIGPSLDNVVIAVCLDRKYQKYSKPVIFPSSLRLE